MPWLGRTRDEEVGTVCCEGLICAACSGRVSDGRCPICRAYRDAHHQPGTDWAAALIPPLLALLAALLVVLALHAQLT
jgi:hypothetical protein